MNSKEQIKVYQVIAENKLTGAPRVVLSLLENLSDEEFKSGLIAPQGELLKRAEEIEGLEIFPVPMRGRADISAIQAINRIIRKNDPDIIHAHGPRAGLLGRIGAYRTSSKIIYTEHTRVEDFQLSNKVLDWAHRIGMKALDRLNTDMNIAVSKRVKEFLENQVTDPEKITVIHNGVETGRIESNSSVTNRLRDWGIDTEEHITIGTIGSLNQSKDHKTLIKAFQEIKESIPEAKLLIIGGGELQDALKVLAEKLGIEQDVILPGYVSDAKHFLPEMDVFVLPSKSEAFGLTLLEAMRAKVPIVATEVGGVPEIITDNQTGVLASVGDPKEMAENIKELIEDEEFQNKLISNYEQALKHFSIEKMVNKHRELYQKIAEKPAIESVD